MIDGFKILYEIPDFDEWKERVKDKIDLHYRHVNEATGEIKSSVKYIPNGQIVTILYDGVFETYTVVIKEITKTIKEKITVRHVLILTGSLHRNHFNGDNHQTFLWQDLQYQIDRIERGLCLPSRACRIMNLEVGINITVDFPVYKFLQDCLISYKGNVFEHFQSKYRKGRIGYKCQLSQYTVKVYDKSKQYCLTNNIMRFELHFEKMEKIHRLGIKYLSDLRDAAKMRKLLDLLIEAWHNVFLFDLSKDVKVLPLKKTERALLTNANNPRYWSRLKTDTPSKYKYLLHKTIALLLKHGDNRHKMIHDLLKEECVLFTEKLPELTLVGHQELTELTKVECQKLTELTEVESIIIPELTIKVKEQNGKELCGERRCLSCGRDISMQPKNTKFCSAKFVGEKAAKRCRNKDSNARHSRRKKIERSMRRGGWLFAVDDG